MYKEIFSLPFRSVSGKLNKITFEKKGYTGSSTEIKGAGSNPIDVEAESIDFVSPIMSNVATVHIRATDYMQELFASDPQGVRVTWQREDAVMWMGYVTQDTYDQDYTAARFNLDIECAEAFASLKYKYFEKGVHLRSFLDIMKEAIALAGPYKNLYVHASTRLNKVSSASIIEQLCVAQSNFFDELDKPMSYYDVVCELCKFLGLTLQAVGDSLYLHDYVALGNGNKSYHRYTASDNWAKAVAVQLYHTTTVQHVGYAASDARLSRMPGKNKIKVKCSLYEISDFIPVFDDEETTYKAMAEAQNKDQYYINRYYQSDKFGIIQYRVIGDWIGAITPSDIVDYANVGGAVFTRSTEYDVNNKPGSLNWTNGIRIKRDLGGGKKLSSEPMFYANSPQSAIPFHKGFFSVSFSFKCLNENNGFWANQKFDTNNTDTHFANADRFNVLVALKIGDYYYDGTAWSKGEKTFKINIDTASKKYTFGDWHTIEDKNSFENNTPGLVGWIIPGPESMIVGDLRLVIYGITLNGHYYANESATLDSLCMYTYLKDIKLNYQLSDAQNMYNDWETRQDKIFENVVSDDYVEEAEDIELIVCTRDERKLTNSAVMSAEADGYIDTLYSATTDKQEVQENNLIDRAISQYSKPRFSVNATFHDNIKCYSIVSDKWLPASKFIVAGYSLNAQRETINCTLLEVNAYENK